MAERRMFAKTIIDSDAFLEMPATSQLLYFHLCMRADDEGFINKPKSIMRLIGCKEDDMKVLFAKKFVIPFESGVVVIKHWKLHNYIRGDRLKETNYTEEKAMLEVGENQAYTLYQSNVSQVSDTCQSSDGIGKVRLGKDSIGKVSVDKKDPAPQYFDSEPLNTAFLDYIKMRKQIKAPMTDRAIELAKSNLKKLAVLPFSDELNEDMAIQILNNSIMNSWKGLFPLKEDKQKPSERSVMDAWRDA